MESSNTARNAIVIAKWDIVMVWTVWIIIMVMEPLMKITDSEVEDKMISASDFTV